MHNQNTQTESSEIDKPKNESERNLIDKFRDQISKVKNWITETSLPENNAELEEKTGDALVKIAEETIVASKEDGDASDNEKNEIIEAVGAAAGQTIDGELAGQPDNPIEVLDKDGYGPELIETTVAIAEKDEVLAQEIADEIDRVQGFGNETEADKSVESRKRLLNGETTASVNIIDGENLSPVELKKQKNRAEAWNEERRAFHKNELDKAIESALELSKKLGPPPRIIAMRGGCGSGKSYTIKNQYGDKGIFDKNGDVPGAVKPDYFKTRIKQHEIESPPPPGVEVSSEQVHMESTGINSMFMRELAENPEASLLIDKQLEAENDIPELIEISKQTGKAIELLDNDVPIELSAYRVLKREVGGTDPNIKFEGVASGFLGIRVNRASVYSSVNSEDAIGSYSLRAFDPESKNQIEIATKQDGEVVVIPGYEELAHKVISQNKTEALNEIEETGKQVITAEYVENFVNKYFDNSDFGRKSADEAKKVLGAYVGLDMTIEDAMHSKADGIEADSSGKKFTPDYKDKLLAWKSQKAK